MSSLDYPSARARTRDARHAAQPVSPAAPARASQFASNAKGTAMARPTNPDRIVKATRALQRARVRPNVVAPQADQRASRPPPPMPPPPPLSDATAVSVKLSPASVSALARASRNAELNMTDTINRALQVYDFLLASVTEDRRNSLLIARKGGGSTQVHLR